MCFYQSIFHKSVLYLCITISGLLCACKNTKVSQHNSSIELAVPGPGECRLKAEVLEVYPPKIQEASKSICIRFSCEAKIKILETSQTGRTFPSEIRNGSEIKVYFTNTLAPGKKVFPKNANPLPGLKQGDTFECVLQVREKLGLGQSFQTTDYIKIN